LITRGGNVPTPAPVTALAFNAHGTTLWAADSKVIINSLDIILIQANNLYKL